ncbi:MAG: DNA-3-methyladenine glycosylase [Tardiphaga sp.]
MALESRPGRRIRLANRLARDHAPMADFVAAVRRRSGVTEERLLCSGPGRLCEALGITDAHDGLALDRPPFELIARSEAVEVAIGPRSGITKTVDHPWRYGLKGSRFLSKAF